MSLFSLQASEKAQNVARKIVSIFDVDDIEDLVTQHLGDEDKTKLMAAIDPEYEALEKEKREVFERLKKSLTNEKQTADLDRYATIEYSLISIAEMGGFQLGFAAACRLFGRQS